MASKWEPHADEIEVMFRRGDSYRAISAALKDRHGLPLDPAGLHRWWKNKLAKRQAREAALRDSVIALETESVTKSAAKAAEIVKELAVSQTKFDETEKSNVVQAKSMKDIIAAAESSATRRLLKK